MKQYIKCNSDSYTHFNIACSFKGEYSEDWDATLLNSILDSVFKNKFGYSYWGVDMFEWPDLYDDEDWLESGLCGMGIDVCCKALSDRTCDKVAECLTQELNKVGYEVADISYEVF